MQPDFSALSGRISVKISAFFKMLKFGRLAYTFGAQNFVIFKIAYILLEFHFLGDF